MKIGCALLLVVVFAFWALMIMLLGCNTPKQATKHYNKAKEKHLPTVALLSKADFPCGVSKADTVFEVRQGKTDTIIREQIHYVDCPDTAFNSKPGAVIKVPVNVPCNCPETSPDTLFRYITQFEKDPRDSIHYEEKLKQANKELVSVKQGRNTWRVVGLIFIGLVALSIFFIIRKFKVL